MKVYSTAVEILEASLQDIRAGRWVCSVLATSKLGEGEDTTTFDGCYIPEDKPMGCALGLISTHGGHGHAKTISFGAREYEVFIPAYPDSNEARDDSTDEWYRIGPTPQAVLDARVALIEARVPGRPGYVEEDTANNNAVYSYNDEITSPEEAAEWFEEALRIAKGS